MVEHENRVITDVHLFVSVVYHIEGFVALANVCTLYVMPF